MTIKLSPANESIGLASHIAIEESGLEYELNVIDMKNSEQKSDSYLKINPKARVPSLIVDNIVLTETPAILVYIAQIATDSNLALPNYPMQFAQIQAFNCYLCSTVHVAHAHKHRGNRWVNDEAALAALKANVPTTMAACFDSLEAQYVKGPWVFGDTFSICDPYLFAISSWFESDGVNIDEYPILNAHRQDMMNRASVIKVLDAIST